MSKQSIKNETGIKPIGKYILIKPDGKGSKVSEFGIVTPPNEETEEKNIGTVIAVGNEVVSVKPNDRIIYPVFGGEQLILEGKKNEEKEYILILEKELLAFIN